MASSVSRMEVEPSPQAEPCLEDGNGGSQLRRSNSAPMINKQSDHAPVFQPVISPRVRRFSASVVNNGASPNAVSPPIRIGHRISQLKREEGMSVSDRETEHEREMHSVMQMSQSWEETSLRDKFMQSFSEEKGGTLNSSSDSSTKTVTPPTSLPIPMSPSSRFAEPLTILPASLPLSSSPSPTRIPNKQCFSPSMQMSVRNSSLSPSPIPSPTRKAFVTRRSQSPGCIRPSILGETLKRKLCSGDHKLDFSSPPKRACHSDNSTPDSPAASTPLIHSLSSSSLEEDASPPQFINRMPGGIIHTTASTPMHTLPSPLFSHSSTLMTTLPSPMCTLPTPMSTLPNSKTTLATPTSTKAGPMSTHSTPPSSLSSPIPTLSSPLSQSSPVFTAAASVFTPISSVNGQKL
ncbi:hypothetical protein Bbelb_086190 [Branchiostoma belcheri]|nr:hypothetical protein Bbelb_086190 [Branchiostoma belcheri]